MNHSQSSQQNTAKRFWDAFKSCIAFAGHADPQKIDSAKALKDYLALNREVAASTQNQALNALVFFYSHVLNKPFEDMAPFVRTKRPRRLPDVLTRDEVLALFDQLHGSFFILWSS